MFSLAGATAAAACEQYIAAERLPGGFVEIASGDLGKAELFMLTDGTCTCDNLPAVSRVLGKPVQDGVNWTCRVASSDERGSN
jgi:hypothetical protein